jgi:hypothetical protein
MATDAVFKPASGQETRDKPVKRTAERAFYSGMAILLCVCVYIGFSPTYFQAGMLRAPLPSPILHIHGAVFTLWMLLFVVQACFISARRVKWHRSFGTVAFCLPPIMIVLGVIAAIDALHRGVKIGPLHPAVSAAIPLIGIVGFTIVIYASWRARRRPDAHKRLILIATSDLVAAAFRPLSLGPHRIAAGRWSRHRPRHPASHSRLLRTHHYPPHPPVHHVFERFGAIDLQQDSQTPNAELPEKHQHLLQLCARTWEAGLQARSARPAPIFFDCSTQLATSLQGAIGTSKFRLPSRVALSSAAKNWRVAWEYWTKEHRADLSVQAYRAYTTWYPAERSEEWDRLAAAYRPENVKTVRSLAKQGRLSRHFEVHVDDSTAVSIFTTIRRSRAWD